MESIKKRRKDNRLILLYKGLKGEASIIPTDDLIPKNRRCRHQHSMARLAKKREILVFHREVGKTGKFLSTTFIHVYPCI